MFNDFADFSADVVYSRLNVFLPMGQKIDVVACNNNAIAIGAIKDKSNAKDYLK